MRWTAVSISEMTIAYRPARTVSHRYDNASRYASHCYLDNVSMQVGGYDIFHAM